MAYVVILAVLAVLWACVIGSWLRDRAHVSHGDSTAAFRAQLSTLQRTQPGYVPPSGRPSAARPLTVAGPGADRIAENRRSLAQAEMRRRRRDVLFALLIAAGVTFLAAVLSGSAALIGLNLVCDLAAAGYVFALVQRQRLAVEQRAKVRYLPSAPPRTRPAAPAVRPARLPMAAGAGSGRPVRATAARG